MITQYSYDNIDAMVKSINSNSELINNMIKTTRENHKEINSKMAAYADNKSVFSFDLMNLYKEYADGKSELEAELNNYNESVREIKDIRALESDETKDGNYVMNTIYSAFSKINNLQIKIMEKLCGIIGRANLLLSVI